jgi:hypothetical protein
MGPMGLMGLMCAGEMQGGWHIGFLFQFPQGAKVIPGLA